ncbi:MAG: epsE 1 [Betaproteobacteria bacterium]|nr:epsE 1 [Betaproteobacteria bacterium]
MSAAPLISVVMPVMNAERTLAQTLRSLFWQTCEDWELIIVDDGSTDRTLEVVRAAADPRIRLAGGGANAGPSPRRNQGIALARGKFVALLDADDIAYPERFATQVKFIREHPECDLVGCGALMFNQQGTAFGRFPLHLTHEQICATPWVGFALPNSSWLGRRAWFERYPYSQDYRRAEDYEVLLRSYRNSRFACVESTLLGYRQGPRSLKKLLVGRACTARAIARDGASHGAWGGVAQGLAIQVAKTTADLLTAPLGLDRWLRGEKQAQLAPAELAAWQAVWQKLQSEQDMKRQDKVGV